MRHTPSLAYHDGMEQIETIRAYLKAMTQAERREVAESLDIPFETLQKFAIGSVQEPRLSAYLKLVKHFLETA